MQEIFVKVRDFVDFTEDNDPYGEHDFGSFTVSGVKIFWKIDYYDESTGVLVRSAQSGLQPGADHHESRRVLARRFFSSIRPEHDVKRLSFY
jgi:hypothetical protein